MNGIPWATEISPSFTRLHKLELHLTVITKSKNQLTEFDILQDSLAETHSAAVKHHPPYVFMRRLQRLPHETLMAIYGMFTCPTVTIKPLYNFSDVPFVLDSLKSQESDQRLFLQN